MKTFIKNTGKIYKFDATNIPAGRLAAKTAKILIGKRQINWQANIDLGDKVIITNLKNIKFTGKKLNQKKYYRTSGYVGGLKSEELKNVFKKTPARVFKKIVSGMLPNNRLKKYRIRRLIIK